MARPKSTYFLATVMLLTSPMVQVACDTSTIIEIEYDRSMAFETYKFNDYSPTPYAQGSFAAKDGHFLLFQLCSIKFTGTSPKDFYLATNKFYITKNNVDDQRSYAGSFPWPETWTSTTGWPFGQNYYAKGVAEEFVRQVQTSPLTSEKIPANSNQTLSISWRFPVYKPHPPQPWEQTLNDLNYAKLYYKDANVMVKSRGYVPTIKELVKEGDLPDTCRPKP